MTTLFVAAQVFEGIDVDKSGFIESGELEAALKKLDLKDTDASAACNPWTLTETERLASPSGRMASIRA